MANRAGLDKKPQDVARMFDQVAERYDLTNAILTGGLERGWRRQVVRALDLAPGQRLLDLAAGTATSSEPFVDAGVEVVACDFSLGMLRVGRRRRPDIAMVAGDGTRLPFADESMDAVTISFALRNVVDYHACLRELLRVTRPGGKLVVCEFSTPTNPVIRAGYNQIALRALPAVAKRFSSNPEAYQYLVESIRAWPNQQALAEQLRGAGWGPVQVRNLTGGVVALHRATRPSES